MHHAGIFGSTRELRQRGTRLIVVRHLEPAAPPGKVYTTLSAACPLARAGWMPSYVGRIELPKRVGSSPAFLPVQPEAD